MVEAQSEQRRTWGQVSAVALQRLKALHGMAADLQRDAEPIVGPNALFENLKAAMAGVNNAMEALTDMLTVEHHREWETWCKTVDAAELDALIMRHVRSARGKGAAAAHEVMEAKAVELGHTHEAFEAAINGLLEQGRIVEPVMGRYKEAGA